MTTPEQVTQFVKNHESATLCTISKKLHGYPFGSVVPYATTKSGMPIIHVATISEHYRNMKADPRVSLFIAHNSYERTTLAESAAATGGDAYETKLQDVPQEIDPQASARVCLTGLMSEVSPEDEAFCAARYWERFPNAASKGIAHTFRFFTLELEYIRWIAGFGSIHWVATQEYQDAWA